MEENNVTYYNEGWVGDHIEIIEKRTYTDSYGVSRLTKFIWKGFFDGGNHIKCVPLRPYPGFYDKIQRQPMVLSIFELKKN